MQFNQSQSRWNIKWMAHEQIHLFQVSQDATSKIPNLQTITNSSKNSIICMEFLKTSSLVTIIYMLMYFFISFFFMYLFLCVFINRVYCMIFWIALTWLFPLLSGTLIDIKSQHSPAIKDIHTFCDKAILPLCLEVSKARLDRSLSNTTWCGSWCPCPLQESWN